MVRALEGRMVTKDIFGWTAEVLAPKMKRMALSILRTESDAQDAVQQALVNAWAKRESIDERRLQGYLMRIVINECRNIQRARMRMFPVESIPESGYSPPEGDLKEAIDALPESLRTPLLLHYMEGCTERETARILSLTIPQIKSRLYRARKRLRQALTTEVTES